MLYAEKFSWYEELNNLLWLAVKYFKINEQLQLQYLNFQQAKILKLYYEYKLYVINNYYMLRL